MNTYEKKYKEALERARAKYSMKDQPIHQDLVDIFPELAEPEDERIRKRLIEFFKDLGKTRSHCWSIYIPDILAWLEKQKERNTNTHLPSFDEALGTPIVKQGEKKPDDKVEPKFKVGDWIVRELDNTCYQIKNCIINVTNNKYGYDLTSGGYISSQDANFYRLWTIRDAKAGDVLVTGNKNIFIFKEIGGYTVYDYCGLYFGRIEVSPKLVNGATAVQLPKDYVPATKEQRDLLFQKMKEAGYEWDAEKKELRKIEQKFVEWSEEDEMMIKFVLTHFRRAGATEDSDIIKWLKSLRPQKQDVMSEDEFRHIVGYLVQDIVANEHMAETEKQPTKFFVEKYYNKLRPQSTWKPSDTQMDSITCAVRNMKESACYDSELVSLYNDLKKLKG